MSRLSEAVTFLQTACDDAQEVLDGESTTGPNEALENLIEAARDVIAAW